MNSRLLQTSDGWVAVTLPRDSDVELLPAWVGADLVGLDAAVRARTCAELVDGAELLGLAVSALGEYAGPSIRVSPAAQDLPLRTQEARVLDLSALWAGPLAAHLLANDGATVVKAESTQRPDNLKHGRPDLYDELNSNKQIVTFDWDDRDALRELVDAADVVIESSRPRALEQRGLVARDILGAADGPRVWASITGYGRGSNRVAFGDDAAVAGGLVRYKNGKPHFKGDAIADPLTGQAAHEAISQALSDGVVCLLDVAMAGVARDQAVREGLRAPLG
ncbi:MAG TPA: CoA transferase [Acidimicrobiales bacterium]|nr:CoA transferase [Acidimicrobiales bacterium]